MCKELGDALSWQPKMLRLVNAENKSHHNMLLSMTTLLSLDSPWQRAALLEPVLKNMELCTCRDIAEIRARKECRALRRFSFLLEKTLIVRNGQALGSIRQLFQGKFKCNLRRIEITSEQFSFCKIHSESNL